MVDAGAGTHDLAVLGTVGRKRVSFALVDAAGSLRPETIRSYSASLTTGVSAALTTFQHDLGLPALPARAGIAVAGLARGDAISITNTRWFVSRSGLAAMTGGTPVIINDFAAEAWAVCGTDLHPTELFSGEVAPDVKGPGCFLVLGITSGFGAALVTRNDEGAVLVLPTEAGHGAFAAATEELARLATDLFPGCYPVAAEQIVSAPGLVAIYTHLARGSRISAGVRSPEEITRSVATDPIARAACTILAKAFWAQAGSLTMTFGAWDGVIVTGALANAIRPALRLSNNQALFAVSQKHRRTLEGVPRAYVTLDHGELVGVAEALRARQRASQ